MSGRGRGINTPAWMSRQGMSVGGGGGGGNLPPPPNNDNDYRRNDFRGGGAAGGGDFRGRHGDYHRGGGGGEPYFWPRDRGPSRGGPPDRYGGGPPPDRYGGPPPRRGGRYGGGGRYNDGPPPRGGDFRGDRRGDRRGGPPRINHKNELVRFRNADEEMAWVEDRRRKRRNRQSKFDQLPTLQQQQQQQQQLQQALLMANTGAAAVAIAAAAQPATPVMMTSTGDGQQTRHARRLYIGNLPATVTEDTIHSHFRQAIATALVGGTGNEEDPILSVYINHERRFAFLEFKTVEMTTACMSLDGLELQKGGAKLKIKRPNDYNPMAAPKVHESAMPQLDVSRLGIISETVLDGPNKIFIGGLHYHLTEGQVLELLQAFGKIKAFHLVKNENDTSKGYCFVEYADANTTAVAIQGLNGMEIGGGKSLTARLAGERTGAMMGAGAAMPMPPPSQEQPVMPAIVPAGTPPPGRNIVAGYDVEALVDAALGKAGGMMPTAPQYLDSFGSPLTRIVVPSALLSLQNTHVLPPPPPSAPVVSAPPPMAPPPVVPSGPAATAVLVLHNMVTPDDLATDEEYEGLKEEVGEECAKFGNLRDMQIPRKATDSILPSAIGKIFLHYETVRDAQAAAKELQGRQFGSSVVDTSYYSPAEYEAGNFK